MCPRHGPRDRPRLGDLGLAVNGSRCATTPTPTSSSAPSPTPTRSAPRGHRPDQARHRRGAGHGRRPDDALARAGRLRLFLPGRLRRLWDWEMDGIREVAEHDPECLISIEYKPNEPRSYSLLPDCATTLLAIRRWARPISASPSTSRMYSTPMSSPLSRRRCRPPQPAARRPSQRRLRQARRRADGRRGASAADAGAAAPDPPRRL